MKIIGVYGASGFGREVIPVLRRQLASGRESGYEITFIDDKPPAGCVNGARCLTYRQFLEERTEDKSVCIAIANSHLRSELASRCERDGIRFIAVRAENTIMLDDVEIGEASILCPFSMITSNVRIGKHFHANFYSYVAHDCVIGDFVTFAPEVKCNGNVNIHDHAYIGAGAVLRQGKPGAPLVIGRGAVVGMGAVVTKDVPDGMTVVGNPARPIVTRSS